MNAAHTLGPLGPSSPPVYLPKVEPPRKPVITKILGGDRAITLTWAANREADLAEYRIYRTDDERKAADVRLMDLVRTVPLSAVDATKPGVSWTDSGNLIGGRKYFYRLTAADTSGNESSPSSIAAGRAFDDSQPPVPTWNPPIPDSGANSIVLSWTLDSPELQALVLRHSLLEPPWQNLTGWLPAGTNTHTDDRVDAGQYIYRLIVMDRDGRTSKATQDLTV